MKKLVLIFISLMLVCGVITAQVSKEQAQSLLQKAQDSTAFYKTDFCGSYNIVHDKPGEGRDLNDAVMYRRDSSNKWAILITGPSRERGKGYLQTDGNIWFYDPADGRFTFTSSKDKFRNTNANNSDFAPQVYASSYAIESYTQEKLGKFDCIVYVLTATVKNIDYPRLKLWVSISDGLTRKKEDYSLSGQKLRTTAIPSYQSITGNGGKDTFYVPVNMIIQDNLKGKKVNGKMEFEKTVINISNVKLEKVEDIVYTKEYLEMMSAR